MSELKWYESEEFKYDTFQAYWDFEHNFDLILSKNVAEMSFDTAWEYQQKEIDKLQAENKILIDALEFYSKKENWCDMNERTDPNNKTCIINDHENSGTDKWGDEYWFGGKLARQALEKIK
jgi:hypothetical protein